MVGLTAGTGGVYTTFTVAVFEQPVVVLVPFTVYTVLTAGAAYTVARLVPVYAVVAVAFVYKPVFGDQMYVLAPLAVRAVPLIPATPPQTGEAGEMVTFGNAFTVRIAPTELAAGGQVPLITQR